MSLNLFHDKGTPIERQKFTWKELVQTPISKLEDDAFTRIRVIVMNGIEEEAKRFSHAGARTNKALQAPLARLRQIEQHQQTLVNGLLGSDHSPLETTLSYEQAEIEVTAAIAQKEPDSDLAQVYRLGLLEDFDHLYRYSALLDRCEGKDANTILQSYTDLAPGRALELEHRPAEDELYPHYDRTKATGLSKFHALTALAVKQHTLNFYMNVGPRFSDPTARQLYAEIASTEEQHLTRYESIIDPSETWLEKWLIHEANEVYHYYSCVESETNSRIKAIWERFLDYELGHLQLVMDLFKQIERRDPAEVVAEKWPSPIEYKSQRQFIREVLGSESPPLARGTKPVRAEKESERTAAYRRQMNSEGSASVAAASGYQWRPGGELTRPRHSKPDLRTHRRHESRRH